MAWETGINTSLLTEWLNRTFIPALENELQYQKFTSKAIIPRGQAKVGRWNVFSNRLAATTKLPEGSTTAGEITTFTTVSTACTIEEWGEFLPVTSLMDYVQVPTARDELKDRFSYGAALTLDTLTRSGDGGNQTGAIATTTAFYAGAGATGGSTTAATPTAMSAAAIIGGATVLRANSALGLKGVSGHPDRHMAAVLTTTAERDMVTELSTGRIAWSQAVTNVPGTMGQEKWVNGYMGSIYGTACYRSQNKAANVTITSAVENNFIIAEGGLGAMSINEMTASIFINEPSSGDIGNPYRNRSTISWHAYFACKLLDSARVVRLYTLA